MHSKTTSKVLPNQYSLKDYSGYKKLIVHKRNLLPSGYEKPEIKVKTERETGKEESNISRARSKIWEYAMCNDFEYFVTFTLNKNKMDRYDLEEFISKLGQFIRNYRRLKGVDLQYLLVPEPHQDGAWHMHGLIKGIIPDELVPFKLSDKVSWKIKEMIRAGRTICNWSNYADRFGFVEVERIQNKEAISSYMTKYIKKNVGVSVTEKHKKAYYCSKGLKGSEVIKKGTLPTKLRNALQFDFENEYVLIRHIKEHEYESILSQL